METANWYYSNNVKMQQRKLNHKIKLMNKNIYNDDLWMGRFFIRQVGSRQVSRFEDGSGSLVGVYLRFYDKYDNTYIDYYGTTSDWCFPGNGWGLWTTMNNFITERCEQVGRDHKTCIDYRSVDCDKVCREAKSKLPFALHCER